MHEYFLPGIGILGTLAVTLGGIIIRRLYKSIDLLFAEVKQLRKEVSDLKLVVIRSDPDSSMVFRTLTR